ncbi:MAG: hypothetical protein KAH07_03095 [Flavobacteriaceae bacterium]|nr:hypothetical protein [Flavobacteriaceae bacterium]
MKYPLLFISILYLIISCGSAKSSEQAINTGNYDKSISISIQKLIKNKTKKGNQQYVLMLEDAYAKVVERDESRIDFLINEGNPESLEEIYEIYVSLNKRKQKIKPLLPLPIYERGQNAEFNFKNYNNAIITSKNNLSEFLYKKSIPYLSSNDKQTLRNVYYDLEYIQKINPGYKDVLALMDRAHFEGTDYVIVSMKNETEMVIPVRLEENLLNFDTYGLNDFWTVFHNSKIKQVVYNFGLELDLTSILVSPEKIREKTIIEEQTIKDGYHYAVDSRGNHVKDSLGEKIKVDNFIKVKCELYQMTQSKSSKVDGEVKYIDLKTNQVLQQFPISSEFIFEHQYITHVMGDKRAMGTSYLEMTTLSSVQFPTNEQMVYDTGTDLKQQLKAIIQQNSFRE